MAEDTIVHNAESRQALLQFCVANGTTRMDNPTICGRFTHRGRLSRRSARGA